MQNNKSVDHFDKIEVQEPSDLLIRQIKDLINKGMLKPGDRLPSESELRQRIGINRNQVRNALKRLELYGIIDIRPQNGSFVSKIGVNTLKGLISNLLNIEHTNLESLLETRAILEVRSAELAAIRSTKDEAKDLSRIHDQLCVSIENGKRDFDEDLYFHLKIAEFAHSPILCSLITFITPDVIGIIGKFDTIMAESKVLEKVIEYHELIAQGIIESDPKKAERGMSLHMDQIKELGEQIMKSTPREELDRIINRELNIKK